MTLTFAEASRKAGGGAGHVTMLTLRGLMGTGMTEAQAKMVVDMAAKPGGLAKLKAAGASRTVMEVLYRQRGGITGKSAAAGDAAARR